MTLVVEELFDEDAIALFLEQDRLWTAYGLADLDPAYRQHSRYLGAWHDGQLVSMLLVFAPPGFEGVLTFGDSDGISAILAANRGLPAYPFLLMGQEHVHVVGQKYLLAQPSTMLRMAVDAIVFSPQRTGETVVRLSEADRVAMEALYASERNSAFHTPATLAHGHFFGIYHGPVLVAVAGTHAWSAKYRIGALGGVFTDPIHRGRGLAQATTGAVTAALFDAGVDDVVLNVRTDNAPALRCYSRLGFSVVRSYFEAQAVDSSNEVIQSGG